MTKILLKTQKKRVVTRPDGSWAIRVFHKKQEGKKMPSYTFKCGCCHEKVEVYYDDDDLEINGVNGSIENWRELLLPLIKIKPNKKLTVK